MEQCHTTLCSQHGCEGLIGESSEIQRRPQGIEKARQRNYPVLIRRESGTGEQLLARLIHNTGPGSRKPFAPAGLRGADRILHPRASRGGQP